MASRWRDWLAHRFGWGPIRDNVLKHRVPKTPWYYGDGSTLMLLLTVLIATGAAMSLTYSPTPDTAHESIRHITEYQTLGWFVRGLHYWAAGLMVVMLFFHLFRLILVAGYKAPREGTWLIGVVLFFLVMAMSFLGYALRWDERAIYAIRVPLHMLHQVPVIGDRLVALVQGGNTIGATTLTRFYAMHVVVIPMLLLLPLVAYHMYLVTLRGVTSPAERETPVATAEEQQKLYKAAIESPTEGEDFHPNTSAKSMVMALSVLALAVILTVTAGAPEVQAEANLVEDSKPAEEWWLWWYSALVAQLPPSIVPAFYVLFPVALFLFLALLPFVDRTPNRGMRKRPIAVAMVVLCVVSLIYLTDLRRRSAWTGWPDPVPPPVPAGVELSENAEKGRHLFAQFGCNSCHGVAGHGPDVGPDMAQLRQIDRPRSVAYMREYILRPPEGVAMPAYEGRLGGEELDRVVDFCMVAQTFPMRQ